ncbi:fasciclin domain-containing protein [Dyadobacter sp. CY327]|uniref:fasciclin domain-containing protein n=1 Tax=Dyadobacter sp. CY327 TaxID=2907301 RepID=UPI001F1832E7|nr:fasciclin domain-containing protein [Dyadobacter sp. CY327]MCE7073765.1 fasciclin domain-containing protein [Dyadobacter sp. CY327]
MKTFTTMTSLKTCLFAAMLAFTLSSCNDDDDDPTADPGAGNIPAVASADPQFSTLVAALTKAELVTTLQGAGPFTVFAPNNAAFTAAGITSLDPLTKDALTPILTSHVVSGTVKAADVKSGTVETVNTNNDIYLSKNADGVFINGKIKVIATDVAASNGVIHVIDNVIVPPTRSLVEIAQADTSFTELVSLVLAADPAVATALTSAVNGLTVFAPNNAAFRELYKTTPKATLLAPANRALLTSVLLYHVVPGRVFSTDLPNVSGPVATANTGKSVTFDLAGGAKVVSTTSGASDITAANILATNGVVHVIDKVLMP